MINDRPLFISGMPKSGTTLVNNLLTNHPDFKIDYDNEAIQQFLTYVHATMKNFFFLKAANNVPPLHEQVVYWQENDFERYHELNKDYFTRMHMAWNSGLRWGSSNSLQGVFHKLIWRWYPKAEYIFVQRDPRDNWSSFRSHEHPYSESGEWDHWDLFVHRYKKITSVMDRLRDDPRTYYLQYHEVVHDPMLVYRTLGIKPPENYLNNADKVLFDRSYGLTSPEAKEVLDKKIITSRVGRWKRDLSPEEIQRCQQTFPELCAYYDEVSP